MRICKSCGEEKLLESFGQTVSEGNGQKYRRHECRQCTYKRQAEWREKNREELRAKATERMRSWRDSMSPERFAIYRQKATEKAKARLDRARDTVYAAYGGYKCECCGETEKRFLTIDHIHNNGGEDRKGKLYGSGAMIYEWILRQKKATGEWPFGLRILCYNCNCGRARNNGICPHEEGSTTRRKP